MMNILLSVSISLFCLSMFSFSTTLGKISRTFEGFDYSYAEFAVSVKGVTPDNGLGPFFLQFAFKDMAKDYFEEHLSPYLSEENYAIDCVFTSPYTVDGKEDDRYCKRATLNFEATFSGSYHYKNSKSFVIKEKI